MRLDPPELGHVQVRIDRPPDAPARVEITVEKVETLTLLLRDQPQLQHALDQAGVPAEGRSVTFHIASPEPAPRSEPAAVPAPGVATGGPSGDGSHGALAEWRPAGPTPARHAGRRRHRNSRLSRRPAGLAAASTSPHDAKGNHPMSLASVTAQQNSREHRATPRHRTGSHGAEFAVGEFQRLPQAADDAVAEPGSDQPNGYQSVHHRAGAVLRRRAADQHQHQPDTADPAHPGRRGDAGLRR